jgi:hypothetical protein
VNVVVNGNNVIAEDILFVEPYWNIGPEYNTTVPVTPLIARFEPSPTGMLNVHTPNCMDAEPLIETP